MALKSQIVRPVVNTGILLVLFLSLLAQPLSASAKGHPDVDALPNFSEFSNAVQDGSADLPRGVYVPNLLALPIVQQPAGNPGFVSKQDGKVTQFSMANKYGNVGLLAHNYLAGKSFSELAIGDEVRLVYGDGRVEKFIVTEVLRYQALQPYSVYSSFRNINTEEVLSAEKMFKRVYTGDRHMVFQTCIYQDGNLSWGRLFILAVPKSEYEAGDETDF